MTKQCKACGKAFQFHPKVPTQTYCSSPECQRERRRRWLEEKRQVDGDYQGNEPQKIEQWPKTCHAAGWGSSEASPMG